ncbi:uncharacterized protein [Phyllobates terribilis]|uniref:uncharacterized protein n=1 Tax=Phyllobates terribilis TaxID=111132 RepID=UPI003CCAB2B2
MHRMLRWIRVLILLGCCAFTSSTPPQENAITNAIDNCNQKMNTDFDLKFLDLPTKYPQNTRRFFKYRSYGNRHSPLLRRLFPWLYKPPTYQFVLTTAWKKPLTETRSPYLEPRNTSHMVVRTCSGFLTDQKPMKWILTCYNVTHEGPAGLKSVEVTPITTTEASEAEEGSGPEQDEAPPEDEHWDLSRCLGCIFGMLNKPMNQ